MKIQQYTLVAAAALALMACNRPAPAPAPQAGNPSSTSTPEDSMLAKVIREKMGKTLVIGDNDLKMRDGKLQLMKDNAEVGTVAADGSLIIDGKPVALTPAQRDLTVKLHAQATQVAADAVAIAGDAANVATTAVSEGMKLAMGSILRGDSSADEAAFEQKIETTVRENIKPGAIRICNSANQMEETRRQLANVVPEYKPYYVAKSNCDVAEMEKEFAGNITEKATSADLPSSTK